MAELLVECRRFVQLIKRTINFDTLKTLFAQLNEFLAVFALAVADDGGQQIGASAVCIVITRSTMSCTCCASIGLPVAGE